ncbi:MAG: hypothetical protein RLZZ598_1168, partial [Pseudomonadota bacterium]
TVCSTPFVATLISGSITGLTAGFDSDAQAAALTLELAPGHSAAAAPECFVSRVPATGPWPRSPGMPASVASATASYHYACLVPMAGNSWSGELRIAARAGSLLRSNDRFCALSWDRNRSGVRGDTNEEHPLVYVAVNRSLAAQNFLFVPRIDATTPMPCSADATVNGLLLSHLALMPL